MGKAARPSWLTPSDPWVPRGFAEAPVLPDIEGKMLIITNRRADVSTSAAVGRGGVKAALDTTLGVDKQWNWIHSSFYSNVGGLTPPLSNLTEAQVRAATRTLSKAWGASNEIEEGNPWGESNFSLPQFHWHYDEYRIMHEEAGLPFRYFGTYGAWEVYNGDPWQYQTGDGSNKAPNDPFFKNKIASVSNARATCSYFSTRWTEGVGAIIKHYADLPDYASRYFNKAFAAEVMAKGMNLTQPGIAPDKLLFVMWGKVEALGSNAPNFGFVNYERPVGNLGKLITPGRHIQVDYDWMVGNLFGVGLVRCAGVLLFDERTRYGTDPTKVTAGYADQTWVPNVSGTPAPSTVDGYPVEPMRWHDAGYEARYLYGLCNRTAGEPWQYCRYKVQGGDWIEPKTDGTTILEHAAANDGAYSTYGRRGRADAMFRIKGNALDVWCFDPSRTKNTVETLILNPVPGKEIQVNLKGSYLELFNETI